MLRYRTIKKEAEAELLVEKSRFIAYVKPVGSKEEADAFFSKIRGLHRNANHNVPAFVIGERFEQQWASDDGEPQGTSGVPMLQMMIKEGLTNVALIVTRYFGGIKLGTGGLMRAYTGAAKQALLAAEICEVHELALLAFSMDYTYLGKLQNLSENGEFQILETTFTDKVAVTIAVEPERTEELRKTIANLSGGRVTELSEGKQLVKKN
ncbi:MAG: YigZ family protein [Eubacteriales bacterium]|nr:YigZ family protein [Eubacteriales bacterium]